MKRFIQTCSFFGLLLVLMVSAQAQISKTYRVQIPFDFSIGQESYEAGTYQVNLMTNRLLLRNQKTNAVKVLQTSFEEKGKSFEAPRFYFDQTEGEKVLVEIAGNDFNVKLESFPTARDRYFAERQTSAEHAAPPAGK